MEQNKTRFYLIRHGETDWNKGGRYQGCTNIQLNDAGREQARLLGERFKFLPLDVVYVSPLDRAVATAAPLAAAHGLTPIQDAHFREINFGEWEGKELAELERECPEDYRAWAEYRGGELRHGAETKAAVGERGRAALEEWSFSAGADTDLYVFSHGSWIAQTVQTVLGLGAIHPDFADVVSMANAHWVRFVAADMPDGTLRWRLVDYNHGPAPADTDQWEHPAL